MKKPTELTEHHHQILLMAHIASHYPEIYALTFAIPNGGQRNLVVAMKLKEEGVKKGVPDIFIAYPTKDYAGLFIELKKPKTGKVSKEQKEWIARLNAGGYFAAVCYGYQEAIETLKDYASL